MIPLRRLDARFIRVIDPRHFEHCDRIEEADGVVFVCPLCFLASDENAVGVHSIICWEPNVSQDIVPGPGRWTLQGTGIDDLTLVAGSSSIEIEGGCAWHGFVREGRCVEDLTPERVAQTRAFWQSFHNRSESPMAEPAMSSPESPAPVATPFVEVLPGCYLKTLNFRFIDGLLCQRIESSNLGEPSLWLLIEGQDDVPAGDPGLTPQEAADVSG